MFCFLKSLFYLPFIARQKHLASSRISLPKDSFVNEIVQGGGDENAAILIHDHLQDWIYIESFTPYPKDKLSTVFGIAEEELDEDLILFILNRLNLPIPMPESIIDFGPIDTPIEIARFISFIRSRSSSI